jgi:glycosyltransferase involved in cell wall biosynthesis
MTALRPLRILELATSGSVGTPEMGPVSSTICALANGFAQLGHSVTVADTRSTQPRSALDPRIDVVTISANTGWIRRLSALSARTSGLHVWSSALLYIGSLRRNLKLDTFDAVHVHDEALACLLSFVAPGRFYYTSHTSVWAIKRTQSEKLSLSERFDAAVESVAIRNSRATIALGDYLGPQVPGAITATIAHGIEPDNWQPLDRSASRESLQIDSEDFVAVFVGRLHPQKGVDVLIEAVRRVAPDLPRLQLVVIGSPGGHYRARERPTAYAVDLHKRSVGLPIRFVGFLDHDSTQLRQYLSAADVAVVPSRHEPFGYVALEALAMSLPVIGSRTGGLSNTVSEEVGLLVPPGDVAALSGAIRVLHDDPSRLRALRARCRARVEYLFNRQESVERHLALFTKVAQEPVVLGTSL